MRRLPFLLALALCGCATQAPEKLAYNKVFRAPERLAKPAKHSAERPPRQAAAEATSLELQAALIAFAHRSREHRGRSRGEPLTSEQLRNWDDAMTVVDELLQKPVQETSSYDVIRARVTLEAELEQDAGAHPALPTELISAVELRMARLGHRMAALRRLKVQPRLLQPDFVWPVSPPAISSLFGNRLHPISKEYRKHNGVDLAADFHQEVYAAAAGTVLAAEWMGGHGNSVRLQHQGGAITTYSHLAEILVEPGMVVKQRQPVGLAGSTGVSTGVHLHFELWMKGRPVDPLDHLEAAPESPLVSER